MRLRISTIIIVLFLKFNFGTSQDIHYSQFYNSPININPAQVGIFNGDTRVNASLRDQWRGVPVPWTTVSISYDRKFIKYNSKKSFFSAGLLYNYDRQGDAQISFNNLNLALSYTRLLNENNILTGGLMLGFASRGFDPEELTWDRQWVNGELFTSIQSGESFDMERVNFLENALGINYRYQKSTRTKVDFGVGAYHILQPESNFYSNSTQKLPRRYSLSAIGSVKLTDKLDLQVNVMHQIQEKYNETILGALGRVYLNEKRGKVTTLELGLGYRTNHALFPTLGIRYNQFYFSGSYDIDLSDFGSEHGKNGGPEVHFRYIMTSVKPLRYFKICPIF